MAPSSQDTGPFESDRQASAASTWSRTGRPPGRMAELNLADLLTACRGAGVTPSGYEQGVLRWLAGFEPAAAMAVAGLIARAHGAGWLEAVKTAAEDGEHTP